jgi:hypothetical protein
MMAKWRGVLAGFAALPDRRLVGVAAGVPGRRSRLAGRETGFVMEGLSETVGWKNQTRTTLHARHMLGHQK